MPSGRSEGCEAQPDEPETAATDPPPAAFAALTASWRTTNAANRSSPGSGGSCSTSVTLTGRLPQLLPSSNARSRSSAASTYRSRSGPAGCSVKVAPAQTIVPPRRSPRGTNSPTTRPVASVAWMSRCQNPRRLNCQLRSPSDAAALREKVPSSRSVPASPRRYSLRSSGARVSSRSRISLALSPSHAPAPSSEDTLDVGSALPRDEDGQAVARLDDGAAARRDRLPPSRDHRDERVAREAELADCGAVDRVAGGDVEVDDLELALAGDAKRRRLCGPPSRQQPQPPCDTLECRALNGRRDEDDEEDGVEDRLAVRHVRGECERREHDRHRA